VEKTPVIKALPKNHVVSTEIKEQGTFANIGGRDYFFSAYTLLTWSDCQAKCANLNMTLISLETIAETTAIFDFIATGAEHAFTDLHWGTGQPSTPPGGPDCTSFAQFFQGWDDDDCGGFLMSYACEQRT
ncbi:hypothetical protein B566_EDAN014920, partial [Ephemera danica]